MLALAYSPGGRGFKSLDHALHAKRFVTYKPKMIDPQVILYRTVLDAWTETWKVVFGRRILSVHGDNGGSEQTRRCADFFSSACLVRSASGQRGDLRLRVVYGGSQDVFTALCKKHRTGHTMRVQQPPSWGWSSPGLEHTMVVLDEHGGTIYPSLIKMLTLTIRVVNGILLAASIQPCFSSEAFSLLMGSSRPHPNVLPT